MLEQGSVQGRRGGAATRRGFLRGAGIAMSLVHNMLTATLMSGDLSEHQGNHHCSLKAHSGRPGFIAQALRGLRSPRW